MLTGSIPSAWIALHPTHRMDAAFWLRVRQLLEDFGGDEDDPKDVTHAIQQVEDEDAATLQDAYEEMDIDSILRDDPDIGDR